MSAEGWQQEARDLGRVLLRELIDTCEDSTVLRVETLQRQPERRKRRRAAEQVVLAEHVPSKCCVTALSRDTALDQLTDLMMQQAWAG